MNATSSSWIDRLALLPSSSLRAMVIVLSALVVGPSLFNGFTSWDDPMYVLNNHFLTDLSWEGLKSLLTTSEVAGNYHPITLLSLAIDYALWKYEAFGYHLTNFILHLVNIFLVFNLLNRWKLPLLGVAVGALLFGIHPFHLEPVAWISSRKDLLWSMFYLIGLLQYLKYREHSNPIPLVLSGLCFLASVLSKGVAVTFPIALLLIDFLQRRKFSVALVLEKVPLLIISVVFGLMAINVQQETDAIQEISTIPFGYSLITGLRNLVIYFFDFFIPYRISPYHPYMELDPQILPTHFYAYLVPVLLLIAGTLYSLRFNRWIAFSMTFFALHLALVLQILPVGNAIMGDRYTYISYLGLIFGMVKLVQWIWNNHSNWAVSAKRFLPYGLGVYFIAIAAFTSLQAQIWKDSYTLWSRVVDRYPDHFFGYLNRGRIYQIEGNYSQAMVDLNKAVALNMRYYQGFDYRARVHFQLQDYERAVADYSKGLLLNPGELDMLLNRGLAYSQLNHQKLALADFSQYIELNPDFPFAYFWRALVWERLNEDQYAILDYTRGLEIDPDNAEAFNNRGWVFYRMKQLQNALADFNTALNITPDMAKTLYRRSVVRYGLQDFQGALLDARAAKRLNYPLPKGHLDKIKQASLAPS